MSDNLCEIREAVPAEFSIIGELMVRVYSQLDGFPRPEEQPAYYDMLRNIGRVTEKPGVALLAAVNSQNRVAGAVVYFADMQYYGSGGSATSERNAAGFRLLAVDNIFREKGIGKQLTLECISRARAQQLGQVIIHSTGAMKTAWNMYESLGFTRSPDLDFMQEDLSVYGFRLRLG